jgi:TPR repeat protein
VNLATNISSLSTGGGGIEQNIGLAAEYYKFAAEHGHPEGALNYGCCLRLLGRWKVPDRSSDFCANPPSGDSFAHDFIACLDEPGLLTADSPELLALMARFKELIASKTNHSTPPVKLREKSKLGEGDSLAALKSARTPQQNQLIEHEADMLKTLKHPFIRETNF